MMYQPATALCLAAVGPPASPSHDHRRPFSALSDQGCLQQNYELTYSKD